MEILELNLQQLAVLGFLIAGIVEVTVRARAKDWWVVVTILSSAVVGGFVAVYYSVDFLAGVTAGLSMSGFLKTLNSFGNKSTPAPSKAIVQ